MPNRCSGAATDSVHRMTTNEAERDDRAEQAECRWSSVRVDEHLDVFGDALVGIVGGVAEKLHAVVVGAVEPVAEIGLGHPVPPADLEPLVEIELIDGEHDVGGGEDAEEQQLLTKASQLRSCSAL